MNGIHIDRKACKNAIKLIKKEEEKHSAMICKATDGKVKNY